MWKTRQQKERQREKARLRRQRERSLETKEEREAKRLRRQELASNESEEHRLERLAKQRERQQRLRAVESAEERNSRLEKQREIQQRNLAVESADERNSRLEKKREVQRRHLAVESDEHRNSRLENQREIQQRNLAVESDEHRNSRLENQREVQQRRLAVESVEQRNSRLETQRERQSQARAAKSAEQHEDELRQRRQAYTQRSGEEEEFLNEINTHCTEACEVCLKQCYPKQVGNYKKDPKLSWPDEFKNKTVLVICDRCKAHLKKGKIPPKAFWNNLDPGVIPDEIKALTEPERKLLSRIKAFLKVVKFDGRFGQYGFKGQAILFALDIFHVSEKLQNMLPRPSDDTDIVVVTETLENLNISRDFEISRARVFDALEWLKRNNPLYKDVTINYGVRLETQDIIRVIPAAQPSDAQPAEPAQAVNQSAYEVKGKKNTKIIHASFNQGDGRYFSFSGVQCFAMALTNIVKAAIVSPSRWNKTILDDNLFKGDKFYGKIAHETQFNANGRALQIPHDGYLTIENLDVIEYPFEMFNHSISLDYNTGWICQGFLQQSKNVGDAKNLQSALQFLFMEHDAGILIGRSKCLAVMHYDGKYYFADSHSCGPCGAPARNGKACIIECNTIQELKDATKRAIRGFIRNDANINDANAPPDFSIHYIDVSDLGECMDESANETLAEGPQINFVPDTNFDAPPEYIPMYTSVMGPIDAVQPNEEDVIEESSNVNEIVRKTGNNIVNVNHEKKAEEFAFYHLFPYGKNGLNEPREIRITPLDYFQSRILGKDPRFQIIGYLFYALSMTELHKIQSTINACCKKVQGEHGAVEDVHLYMKNIRGSAAYWKSVLNDLIGFIRTFGPPTWFITLSCNDLRWPDMIKALLLAANDERAKEDEPSLRIDEVQKLIEKHPVTVSRHFMRRLNAFIAFIKANDRVLGGKVVDYWWRIEFQNRGSPHVHMVVWIENAPSFETAEGIQFIDNVITCSYPSEAENENLHDLVKRNQKHRHTHTCYKNSESCRFAFPRQPCNETRMVSETSDEFIRNGGRICTLKRKSHEKSVNNYNETILKLWDGNMDIQPCGTNEAIAQYVAKYISKSEPTELNAGIAQAIRQIQREDGNLPNKLFRICMKIANERQISACECVWRLCHLPYHGSTRECVFLNARKPEQRYHVLQFQGNQATGFCTNMFERYEKRPREIVDGIDFPRMTTVEFFMRFKPDYKKISPEEESVDAEVETGRQTNRRITLVDGTKMIERSKEAAVRSPFFVMHQDPDNYFYSLLIQYCPYYQESELLEGFDNPKEAFLAREPEMRIHSRFMERFRETDRHLQDALNRARAFEIMEIERPMEIEVDEEMENEPQRMTDDNFENAKSAMNLKQRELFKLVAASIDNQKRGDTNRLRLFVTGGAGVGKTFTFKILVELVNRSYEHTAVKVAAPTGVAALLVGGSTLHSLLKLPIEKTGVPTKNMDQLTGRYLKVMRHQWKNIEFLFIDEISMVSYQTLSKIHTRLGQLKNNLDQVFGGLNVIVFGDLMQLPPVRGAQVFHQPLSYAPAPHLWREFTLVELSENMRQRGDTRFADLLNALRVGELNVSHFELLMSKMLTDEDLRGDFAVDKAIRINPTKAQVQKHNDAVLELNRKNGVRVYKIKAQDQIIDAPKNVKDPNIDEMVSKDTDKTGSLQQYLEIFVGARVMLRYNVRIEEGLVNGAMGQIVEIKWGNGTRRDQLYEEDIPDVKIDFGSPYGSKWIQPQTVQFDAIRNKGKIERRQLPLILCWSCTVHKMQGCTVDKAVVNLGSKLFADGQAYVALSRVRSLEGLRIEELDLQKLTGRKPCNEDAIREMERMRNQQPQNRPQQN